MYVCMFIGTIDSSPPKRKADHLTFLFQLTLQALAGPIEKRCGKPMVDVRHKFELSIYICIRGLHGAGEDSPFAQLARPTRLS